MGEDDIAVGKPLDAAVYAVLLKMEFPRAAERWSSPAPWSTNMMSCMGLIQDFGVVMKPPWTITLILADRFGGAEPLVDPFWQCRIECEGPAGFWYCDAEAETLPEAFCRALLQEQES